MKRVLVVHSQIPFVRGGAEMLAEGLVSSINKTLPDVMADLVQIPFSWIPESQILFDLMSLRLMDVKQSDGIDIDLVIGTKFPSYAVNHRNKVLWLVHQHRLFYDLEFTSQDRLIHFPPEQGLREKIRRIDTNIIKECKEVFTISQTVTSRLKQYNGIDSEVLYPPSIFHGRIKFNQYNDAIVCIARMNSMKRQDLLVKSLTLTQNGRALFIGNGQDEYVAELKTLIHDNGLEDRCEILGYLPDNEMLEYLANCRAVFYAPVDEDYGYATLEAFEAKKPVITCHDSGEVAEIVRKTNSGSICSPNPYSIASAIDNLYSMDDEQLNQVSVSGNKLAGEINWETILDKLVLAHL